MKFRNVANGARTAFRIIDNVTWEKVAYSGAVLGATVGVGTGINLARKAIDIKKPKLEDVVTGAQVTTLLGGYGAILGLNFGTLTYASMRVACNIAKATPVLVPITVAGYAASLVIKSIEEAEKKQTQATKNAEGSNSFTDKVSKEGKTR